MSAEQKINRRAPQPLYLQVKKDLLNQINSQELNPGDVLPTEEWLCNAYQVSRVTVRKAIEELLRDGVVERDFSKAARVAHKRMTRSLNHLDGLYEELSKNGFKPSSYILRSQQMQADETLAGALGIAAGDPVLYIDRMRYADDQPICQQIIYLNAALCPGLDPKELIRKSLYETLEKQFGLKIDYAKQTIDATTATIKQAALLEMEERSNVLKVTRNTYLKSGACVEYSESFYVACRYHLSMTLYR